MQWLIRVFAYLDDENCGMIRHAPGSTFDNMLMNLLALKGKNCS
jgi:hypothetical protein